MANLDQVVDFRSAANSGFAKGSSVDADIGPDFHIVLNSDNPLVRPFMGSPGFIDDVAKTVGPDNAAAVNDHPIADDAFRVDGNVGMNNYFIADHHVIADHHPGGQADLRP